PGAEAVVKSREYADSVPMPGRSLADTPTHGGQPQTPALNATAVMAEEKAEAPMRSVDQQTLVDSDESARNEESAHRGRLNPPADDAVSTGFPISIAEEEAAQKTASELGASAAPPSAMKLSAPAAPPLAVNESFADSTVEES